MCMHSEICDVGILFSHRYWIIQERTPLHLVPHLFEQGIFILFRKILQIESHTCITAHWVFLACRQSLNMEKTGFCDRGSRYNLHWCVHWEYQTTVPRDYTLIMNLNLLKSICSSKCNWLSNPISDRNPFPLRLTLFLAQKKWIQIWQTLLRQLDDCSLWPNEKSASGSRQARRTTYITILHCSFECIYYSSNFPLLYLIIPTYMLC